MGDLTIYEKLIILELQKRIKDEEDEMLDVISEKYKQYKIAYHEYVNCFSLFTRLISSARNIHNIIEVSSKLQNVITSKNLIKQDDSNNVNMILKCPNYDYMSQNTIDLMHQAICGLRFDKKIINDIYFFSKRNKHLKEIIDNILISKEDALKKSFPNLIDSLVLSFDIE